MKYLLHPDIRGNNIALNLARSFSHISVGDLPVADYDTRFFEAKPTSRAVAYDFKQRLKHHDQATIEEWAALFLLHYFGVIHIERLAAADLQKRYDATLWPALTQTHREVDGKPPRHLELLRTGAEAEIKDGLTVGGVAPEIVFFGARDRSQWTQSKAFQPYLATTTLSWTQCVARLVTEENKLAVYQHLMRVANEHLTEDYRTILLEFLGSQAKSPQVFYGLTYQRDFANPLAADPYLWERGTTFDNSSLLENYPLKQRKADGGWIYFLLTGLPLLTSWMTQAYPGLPAPIHYTGEPNDRTILVEHGGQKIPCALEPQDEIKHLRTLFLKTTPYCAAPAHTARVHELHKRLVGNKTGVVAANQSGRKEATTIYFAPITAELLQHFPLLLSQPNQLVRLEEKTEGTRVTGIQWVLHLNGLEVRWEASLVEPKKLTESQLSLWPPRYSPHWGFYILQGRSNDHPNRWELIGEGGSSGKHHSQQLRADSDEERYLSILQGQRPAALLLRDDQREHGVLWLEPLPEAKGSAQRQAQMAIDFGTSNTCLAYKIGEVREVLRFTLAPQSMWMNTENKETLNTIAGTVPVLWGLEKGYLPTILLRRKAATFPDKTRVQDIRLEHLFQVDIPYLRVPDHAAQFLREPDSTWEEMGNLKWDFGRNEPYRSLFLSLLLTYAHAELLFQYEAKVTDYTFTFPLALPERELESFHSNNKTVVQTLRTFCYEPAVASSYAYHDHVNESMAIARSADVEPSKTSLDIFMDVGGGTTDIALRYGSEFIALESVRVAGEAFLRFAHLNYKLPLKGADTFTHLMTELLSGVEVAHLPAHQDEGIRYWYPLLVMRPTEGELREKEGQILKQGFGAKSYQRFRSILFYQHLLTYALIQGCAAAVDQRLNLPNGLHLVLAGNGWGLLMFAELERVGSKLKDIAENILQKHLKPALLKTLAESERPLLERLKVSSVDLLNETSFREAKTSTAFGALRVTREDEMSKGNLLPYTGITIPALRINDFRPIAIRWFDRWDKVTFQQALAEHDFADISQLACDEQETLQQPFDPLLSVFTRLANRENTQIDPAPPATWEKLNGPLFRKGVYLDNGKTRHSPLSLFLTLGLYDSEESERKPLNVLAKETKNW